MKRLKVIFGFGGDMSEYQMKYIGTIGVEHLFQKLIDCKWLYDGLDYSEDCVSIMKAFCYISQSVVILVVCPLQVDTNKHMCPQPPHELQDTHVRLNLPNHTVL